jgi:hypothetical protein
MIRILALSRNIKEPTSDISGLQRSTAQLSMMNYIWDHLSVITLVALVLFQVTFPIYLLCSL